ncbi:MAG: Sporulation initiation inhibitor protein Soj [Anaerolineae bacterium]|nr:Sporulation initiation inhibitor protein Soj [Anaerolineae bacterium]
MSRIIAISNHKGGVAKTTTCFSLGACLASLGQRTLIVDLDPQADLTAAAAINLAEPGETLADWLPPFRNGQSRPLPVYPTAAAGLDILPADSRLASAERHLYDTAHYETILAELLQPLNTTYSYILLDCPPSLGAITLACLTAAQHAMIPVQTEYFAARRLNILLEVISAIKQRTNPGLDWHLLATMYDQRNRISCGILDQLKHAFPGQLLDTVIGVDTRLRESPAVGEPISMYAPRTRASRQYFDLAREIHQKIRPE